MCANEKRKNRVKLSWLRCALACVCVVVVRCISLVASFQTFGKNMSENPATSLARCSTVQPVFPSHVDLTSEGGKMLEDNRRTMLG